MVDTIKWTTIAGTPTHYARDLDPPLRTEGRARAFRSTPAFKEALDETFSEIWDVSGLGPADAIVSAGALVNKPGMHGKGAAFDLDGIVWHATNERPEVRFFAIDFNLDPVLYCAVGCVLSRFFVHCLHYLYNAPHEDHFHIDTSQSPMFSRGSRARVSLLQASLHFVHGMPVLFDGQWGQRTDNATAVALARLGLVGSLDDAGLWREYLLRTARVAFSTALHVTALDDPDRIGSLDPPTEFIPEEDHERAPEDQKRVPRLFVKRPLMENDLVRALQIALEDAEHPPGPIDGIYGSLTRAGVVSFQKAHRLEVDGVAGPITLGALGLLEAG